MSENRWGPLKEEAKTLSFYLHSGFYSLFSEKLLILNADNTISSILEPFMCHVFIITLLRTDILPAIATQVLATGSLESSSNITNQH